MTTINQKSFFLANFCHVCEMTLCPMTNNLKGVTWISLGYGLRATDHEYDNKLNPKSDFLTALGHVCKTTLMNGD